MKPEAGTKGLSTGLKVLAVIVTLVVVRFCISLPGRKLRGPEDAGLLIVAPRPIIYDGPGTLHYYGGGTPPQGSKVVTHDAFHSQILNRDRELLIHLSAGYGALTQPLPLIVFFHGYLDRPQHMARALIPVFDKAVGLGKIPPSVLVFPDLSIGGNGEDDPATPELDERLGSWGVNSNLGRYHDHLMEEIFPWVRQNFRVRADKAGTALVGYSAGGFIALNLSLKHPDLALSAAGIAATIDARYAVKGFRLRPYRPEDYQAIADDDPDRVLVHFGPLGRFTDQWAFWPVFDSDKTPGPVWREDQPVWRRLREENPMDLVRDAALDLSGHAFYLVAGEKDLFFYQHHIPLFSELLKKRGARVDPQDPVRPGGHALRFVGKEGFALAQWLGERFRALDFPGSEEGP